MEILTPQEIRDKYALEKFDREKFLALSDESQKLYSRINEIEKEREAVIEQSKQRFEAELEDGTKGVVEVFCRGYSEYNFYPITKKGAVSLKATGIGYSKVIKLIAKL